VNEQQTTSMASACLARVMLATNIQRLRATVNAVLGIYEEQAARRQYDILGDGSV
jgi:hypothetical protein